MRLILAIVLISLLALAVGCRSTVHTPAVPTTSTVVTLAPTAVPGTATPLLTTETPAAATSANTLVIGQGTSWEKLGEQLAAAKANRFSREILIQVSQPAPGRPTEFRAVTEGQAVGSDFQTRVRSTMANMNRNQQKVLTLIPKAVKMITDS